MKKLLLGGAWLILALSFYTPCKAAGYSEFGEYGRPFNLVYETYDSQEQINEEILLGEMELISQLVEAEAGNQPFEGKVKVAEVVLNRMESPLFPDTAEEVIFQKGQFSVTTNGAWEKAAWNMKEDDYLAVEYAISLHEDKTVLYFNNCRKVAGTGKPFKLYGHWFNT